MRSLTSIVTNELEKIWLSRWVVFAAFFGTMLVIAIGLYAFYAVREHRWAPQPQTPWQTTYRFDVRRAELQLDNYRAYQRQSPNGRVAIPQPLGGVQNVPVSKAITDEQQLLETDRYLLDHNIAPPQVNSLTFAALVSMGWLIMFLLARIIGWLSAEQVAGERSDRTMAILLSRPVSRSRLLVGKVIAMFIVALGASLVALLMTYCVVAFLFGSSGPLNGSVGIALDGSKPISPSNIAVLPAPVVALMCLGAAMLSILGIQWMSVLISTITSRWAAVGITLAILFGGPIVSAAVNVVLLSITGTQTSADFLNYLFFNLLNPVGALAPVFASSPSLAGFGISVFEKQLIALAGWTAVFSLASLLVIRGREEGT